MTKPSEGTTEPSEGTAKPLEGMTEPSEGMTGYKPRGLNVKGFRVIGAIANPCF